MKRAPLLFAAAGLGTDHKACNLRNALAQLVPFCSRENDHPLQTPPGWR